MNHARENKFVSNDPRRDRLVDALLNSPLARQLAASMNGDGSEAVRARATRALEGGELTTDPEQMARLTEEARDTGAALAAAKIAFQRAQIASDKAGDRLRSAREGDMERRIAAEQICSARGAWLEQRGLLTVAEVERVLGLGSRSA